MELEGGSFIVDQDRRRGKYDDALFYVAIEIW